MPITRPPAEDHRARARRRFALPLLAASVLLHLAAFQWAEGRLGSPSLRENKPDAITTVMLPAPPAKPALPPQPAAAPKPKVKRKRPPVSPPAPPPETASAAPPAIAEMPDDSSESTAEVIAAAASDAAADLPEEVATETAPIRYAASPPPSATLEYDVQALSKGQNWYGTGVYQWQFSEGSYSVTADANVTIIFKINALNVKSEGVINDFGLAPVRYSEKKRSKPMTNTHFRHDARLISFSASEATYPYQEGAQDRASIIWQLAAIGRGDGSQFASGAEFDIFVAGRRDAETWHIRVIGEEEIDTPFGKLLAWHVVRAPRAGSYDEQLDIWFVPQHEWYPAKVRYTYANGDYTELSLSNIASASAN